MRTRSGKKDQYVEWLQLDFHVVAMQGVDRIFERIALKLSHYVHYICSFFYCS